MNRIPISLVLILIIPSLAHALKLAPPFGDHMVLQRDMPVPIWGRAAPSSTVTVDFAGQSKTAQADAEGNWMLDLDPMEASREGRTLTVKSDREGVSIEDVLIGEVWVCSGQSNMKFDVKRMLDAEKEIAAANYPEIRLLGINGLGKPWDVCSPQTVSEFSAVAYVFATRLQEALGVPIGLLSFSIGGSSAFRWTSRDALKSNPELWAYGNEVYTRERYEHELAYRKRKHDRAVARGEEYKGALDPGWEVFKSAQIGALYGRYIDKVVPFAIRGFLWYQGESDKRHPQMYAMLFPLMIQSWREVWGEGDIPFYFVQLPGFETSAPADIVGLREAQADTLSLPNTGMVVTIDVGEAKDNHPANKRPVGERAALLALARTYDKPVVDSGPVFASVSQEDARLRVHFAPAESALVLKVDEGGFEVAGEERVFHPAEAKIEGDTLLVWSTEVSEPVAVRYAWIDTPEASLFNTAGLPAAPFRSDDWPSEAAVGNRDAM